jgi:formylglycine-generating enzyme required for sulfatase activity
VAGAHVDFTVPFDAQRELLQDEGLNHNCEPRRETRRRANELGTGTTGETMRTTTTFLASLLGSLAVTQAAPPLPVTDLQIQLVDSAHVHLDWSPVTQDTLGNPLDCVFYDVHRSESPGFLPSEATWIDSTSAASYTDSLTGDRGFYRVQVQSCPEANPLDLVLIPAGQFMMGQVGVATPEHSVTLTNDFLLGRTEVTNGQYVEALNWAQAQGLVSVVGVNVRQYNVDLLRIDQSGYDYHEIRYNAGTQQFYLQAGTYDGGNWGPGYAYPGGSYDPANHPVKYVTWYGAACYCDWLSQMNGLPAYYNGNWEQIPSPNNPYTAMGYRLPTEAEWEFAAQHDDERSYPWGSASPTCTLANYLPSGYCVGWTSPVGNHPAGAGSLDLQDMAGNVWEWNNDWYAAYSSSPQSDPAGPDSGSGRILRGGGWATGAVYLPCAYRNVSNPLYAYNYYGFRLCRTLP